jgi:hypothetical protein
MAKNLSIATAAKDKEEVKTVSKNNSQAILYGYYKNSKNIKDLQKEKNLSGMTVKQLKDYIGTIKPEQLANLKTFLSQNLTFNSKKNIKDNYVDFLNQLNDLVTSNPNSGVLKNLYNAIPKTINDTPTTSSQILKIAKLKNNFNLDTLFDYLLDTLVTLNEVTKQFYTIDVNPQNLYADNSVVISYNNSNQTVVQVIENKASSNMTKNYNPTYFC